MKRVALLSALFLLEAGCAAPADPKELNHPVCRRLVNARLVTVEVIHANGVKAVGRSLERAIEGFSKYVAGQVRTVEGEPIELEVDKDGLLSRKQLNPVIARARYGGPSDISVFLVPGLSDYQHRGHCERRPNGHHVIVIQTKHVDRGTPSLVARDKWWELVIKHELLHALDVPYDRSHAWSKRHCTHPDCILYPRVDSRAIAAAVLRLGPPMDLCSLCRREVRQAQDAARGKPLDSEEPYDHMKWLDELVRLNPKNPNAYTVRARQHTLRKDYDKAIADLSKAIDVSGENHLCYLNRAGVFKIKGDLDGAKRDLDRMTELAPNTAPALNNLAWLLATHWDKWIRDGSYAVRLARRACELTEWKDPRPLDTLAAAYAESARFDEAVEYQDKALSLADEKAAEGYRRRLKLYRSGKPYRASGN